MNEGPQITELDTHVCENCVVDSALQIIVSDYLTSYKCDYCDDVSEDGYIAAPFNLIMYRVYESVSKEWSDAQDVDMPWVEGGWLEEQSYIYEVLEDFNPGWGSKLLEDIAECFDPMAHWVRHSGGDWSISDPSDTLIYGWESFKNQVLTKTRYLFLSEPEDEFSSGRPDYIPIPAMLNALGQTCINEKLIQTIPAGSEFYRVRAAKKNESFSTFSEMGVPPVGVASAGRMNPAGISYFYIAYDRETAEKEVISWSKRWYLAKFVLKKDITVIDFSTLPEIPSIFEPDLYQSRHNRYFLKAFCRDLLAPVEKDDREHVDYVPTQIVSEYFRHNFKDESKQNILGIKYSSVKNNEGENLAVFLSDNDEISQLFDLSKVIECC